MRTHLLALQLALVSAAAAQGLVRDINQTPVLPEPGVQLPTALENTLLFDSRAPHGVPMLGVSDGTPQGTSLLNLGGKLIVSITPIASNKAMVLSGSTGDTSLSRTDGTPNGTWELPTGEIVSRVIQHRGQAVWVEKASPTTLNVVASDGSVSGTRVVTQLQGSVGGEIASTASAVFVHLRGPANQWELHTTTFQGNASFVGNVARFSSPIELAGKLIFRNGSEAWVTDGTPAGPIKLASSLNGEMRRSGPYVYFAAHMPPYQTELFRTDGTQAGTQLVADLNQNGASSITLLGELGDEIVFGANGKTYISDGTNVRDLGSPITYGGWGLSVRDTLFFYAVNSSGPGLWTTDGTAAGTRFVKRIQKGILSSFQSAVFGGDFYFAGGETLFAFGELWRSDGTPSGTTRVWSYEDMPLTRDSYPKMKGRFDDLAVLSANDGIHGTEPWLSDGTSAGTRLLADLVVAGSSNPDLFVFGEEFFLFDAGPSNNRQLWRSDATPTGTFPVGPPAIRNHLESRGTSLPNGLVVARVQENLWRSDGTAAGTYEILALPSSPRGPRSFITLGAVSYFIAQGADHQAIYTTDGTTSGTRVVYEPNQKWDAPIGFAILDDWAYFAAWDGGPQPWSLRRVRPGMLTSEVVGSLGGREPSLTATDSHLFALQDGPTELFASDGTCPTLLFSEEAPTSLFARVDSNRVAFTLGDDLWVSNGTMGGTSFVLDLQASDPEPLIRPVGGGDTRLLFYIYDGPGGLRSRIGVTDGTYQGTRILPVPALGVFHDGIRVGRQVLYPASGGLVGEELYAIDLESIGDHATEPYGFACGSPTIQAAGAPSASLGGNFSILLEGARPQAPAGLLWSQRRGATRLGLCNLGLAAPIQIISTMTDMTGMARVDFPRSPSIIGAKVNFQWAVLEPGASPTIQTSRSLEVVGGP